MAALNVTRKHTVLISKIQQGQKPVYSVYTPNYKLLILLHVFSCLLVN